VLKEFLGEGFVGFKNFEGVHIRVGEIATTKSSKKVEVAFGKRDIFVICKIVNFSPPFFVGLTLHEFLKFVLWFGLDNFFAFDCVASVILERVPFLWDISSPEKNFLI